MKVSVPSSNFSFSWRILIWNKWIQHSEGSVTNLGDLIRGPQRVEWVGGRNQESFWEKSVEEG